MKKTIVCIMAILLMAMTACTNGNVSTTDDGRVNGGETTSSTSGILDIPDRIEDEIMPSESATENNGRMRR